MELGCHLAEGYLQHVHLLLLCLDVHEKPLHLCLVVDWGPISFCFTEFMRVVGYGARRFNL
jgi:hypothetical protein